MLLNCGAREDSWVSGAARRSNQSIIKKITLNIHWKDLYWSWCSNTLASWCEELTHWKRPGRWERLRAGGQQRMRGLDSINESMDMSLSKLCKIVKDREPGALQSMGLQRVRPNLATKQQYYTFSHYLPLTKRGFVFFTLRSWGKHRDLVYTL